MTLHPSWLELDALHLGADDERAREHARSCARCSTYLEQVRAPAPLPHSLRESLLRTAPARRVFAWAAATSALIVMLIVVSNLPSDGVRPKAAPAVLVHARQGERLSVWDDKSPFSAGDAVRFEVATAGLSWVVIVSPLADGGWDRLYEGRHDGPSAVLPTSLRFDDSTRSETVFVIFSAERLSTEALAAATQGKHAADVFTTRLEFPRTARGSTP